MGTLVIIFILEVVGFIVFVPFSIIMAAIRELQETKKQIASAARKKWWQFWK